MQSVGTRATHTSASGTTLVEMLLVIALIAILIATLVPSVGSARDAARRMADLGSLRQHGVVFHAYGADNGGFAPCIFDPRGRNRRIQLSSGYTIDSGEWGYFTQHRMWPWLLADAYYDGDVFHPSFFSTRRSEYSYGDWTDFYWTAVFLADSKFWDLRTRTGCEQLRGVKFDEVADPARKVLHANAAPLRGSPTVPGADIGFIDTERVDFGLCDGSARTLWRRNILGHDGPGMLAIPEAQCSDSGMRLGTCDYSSVGGMITVHGARGRDVR